MSNISKRNYVKTTCQINGMNGRIVGKKPLYVGLAQPKEERRAMLNVCYLVFTYAVVYFSLDITLTFTFCLSLILLYMNIKMLEDRDIFMPYQ